MGYYVYQLRLETSAVPFYIGKGTGDRAKRHFHLSRLKTKSHKNNVITKAMAEGVAILTEILFDGLSEDRAHAKEVELIAFYGRRVNGGCLTNATDGGEGSSGASHSATTREKLSVANKGKLKSPETRSRMSYAKRVTGSDRKCISRDSRSRMSESKIGSKNSGWLGTYVTPWGMFDSLSAACSSSPFPISQPTVSKYCRSGNDVVFTGNSAKKLLNGKTPRERGFAFISSDSNS